MRKKKQENTEQKRSYKQQPNIKNQNEISSNMKRGFLSMGNLFFVQVKGGLNDRKTKTTDQRRTSDTPKT